VRVVRSRSSFPASTTDPWSRRPWRPLGRRSRHLDYVFPLDADDLLAPDGLHTLRAVLDADRDAAAAWASVQSFGDLDHVHRARPSLDPWQVSYQNHLPICSLYRRTALLEVGGWQLPGGYEDWDLWSRSPSKAGKGSVSPR
jgi:hypothetical protein